MKRNTRRKFVRDCVALGTVAWGLPWSVLAAPQSTGEISFRMFAALIHSRFGVRDGRGKFQAIELVDARQIASAGEPLSAGSIAEQFSLLFRGTSAEALPQDTYLFHHPQLGRFDMFIVPVGRGDGPHVHFEAVFHRLSPAMPQPTAHS